MIFEEMAGFVDRCLSSIADQSMRQVPARVWQRPTRTHGRLVSTRLLVSVERPLGYSTRARTAARRRGDDTRYTLLRARSVTQPARNAILYSTFDRPTTTLRPHRPLSPARKAPLSWNTRKVLDLELQFEHGLSHPVPTAPVAPRLRQWVRKVLLSVLPVAFCNASSDRVKSDL